MSERALKYSVLKHTIVENINNEEYKVGELIPSERELMEMFSVSRITVRKAIDDLVNEGYLYRVQGKGTYVKSEEMSHDLFSITSCTEDIKARGMTPSTKVVSAAVLPADRRRMRTLQIPQDSLVFRLERIYYADNSPINYTTTCLPMDLFPGLDQYDFSKESLYSVIEKKYGVKITHARRMLEAVLAHDKTAEYLGVKAGEPLILFRCNTYGEINGQERVIETFKCAYRTDLHKFYIDQVR